MTTLSYPEQLVVDHPNSLGLLVMYNTSTTAEISQKEYVELREANGNIMPYQKPPLMANVFRRACRALEYSDKKGMKCHMEDNGFNDNFVSWGLFAGTNAIATVTLNKVSEEVEWDPWGISLDSLEIAKYLIQLYMDQNGGVIYSLPLRQNIKRTIEEQMVGIPYKTTGGVFFVPNMFAKKVGQLVKFCYGVNGISTYVAPLVDDVTQRDILNHSLNSIYEEKFYEIQDKLESLSNPTVNQLDKVKKEIDTLSYLNDVYQEISPKMLGAKYLVTVLTDDYNQLWSGNGDS